MQNIMLQNAKWLAIQYDVKLLLWLCRMFGNFFWKNCYKYPRQSTWASFRRQYEQQKELAMVDASATVVGGFQNLSRDSRQANTLCAGSVWGKVEDIRAKEENLCCRTMVRFCLLARIQQTFGTQTGVLKRSSGPRKILGTFVNFWGHLTLGTCRHHKRDSWGHRADGRHGSGCLSCHFL